MRHLDNIYDPRLPDAVKHLKLGIGETVKQAWDRQQAWLADKFIGRPVATKFYTVEQLEALYMVGIYTLED